MKKQVSLPCSLPRNYWCTLCRNGSLSRTV